MKSTFVSASDVEDRFYPYFGKFKSTTGHSIIILFSKKRTGTVVAKDGGQWEIGEYGEHRAEKDFTPFYGTIIVTP